MTGFFVHERGLCESAAIGAGTRIWAFAHVLPGAVIGAECNICDHVFIENDVTVGDRVTIKSGVQLWDGVRLEDDVFIGPNTTFTNDRFPRSKVYPERFLPTLVRRGASVGANATLLPGIEIGAHACVGAGAVVTQSVPANAIVVGNPARIIGYVDDPARSAPLLGATEAPSPAGRESGVRGVTLHTLPQFRDARGDLSVGDFGVTPPFQPRRYFLIHGVPSRQTRGEHAHKACHQFLICVSGSCTLLADDGVTRRGIRLDRPTLGVHLSPMVWGTLSDYSPDAVLLVFASAPYDPEDYLRDYGAFLSAVRTDQGNS